MSRATVAFAVVMALVGCPGATKPIATDVVVDAGQSSLAIDAGAAEVDAGVADAGPVHSKLRFTLELSIDDGGAEVAEQNLEGAPIEVGPLRGLSVTSVALRDYRIRVIDSADQVVPSDDWAAVLAGGLKYSMGFVQPLKPGRTYYLTIEAQNGAQLLDVTGKPWDDVRLPLRGRGDPEPEAGKPARKKKKR